MRTLFALGLLLTFATPARAELINLGNGMIYDTVQDLTWLQDLNFVQHSGFDADGRLTYDQAEAYVSGLTFGGYDDWRLPQSRNNLLESQSDDEVTDLMNQLGGHPRINSSGLWSGYTMPTSLSPFVGTFWFVWVAPVPGSEPCLPSLAHCYSWMGWTTVDQSAYHWSADEPGPTAWAVRDGPSRVPEPSTWLLVGLGLIGLVRSRR